MSIKTKVASGVAFLFAVIITVAGVGLYYLEDLSADARNILKDNYESLEYTKSIIENCDSLRVDSARALAAIDRRLRHQEENVTEGGERELTHTLRASVEQLKNTGLQEANIKAIRTLALAIQDVNMQAIIHKNQVTLDTSRKASMYLIVIGTLCTLVAFSFLITFPGYIANPIEQLTRSIKSIADKKYEERLHFDRRDEFEELAEAFNLMAEKLDEYEHSSLARILFEKKRIETIINRMTDPVIGLDETNRIIFANDPALDLLNLSRPDVIEHYAPDVAVNNDLFRNLIRLDDDGTALLKAVVNGKENYFTKDRFDITITPTGERDSLNIGKLIMLKNVTSFKALDLAKTNFIATISHELKTPIASLQLCGRLLADTRVGTLNEEQKNLVTTLTNEVARLAKITSELLDLSQIETGNIKLSIQKTRPQEIVSRAVEAVAFFAERKHIAINILPYTTTETVRADVEKTTWVLVNFLTNAIRYSPEHGEVLVQCGRDNGSVSFSVTDRGPGIDALYLPRIFEKFFQVPGTPSSTGLGLAISKEFIEAQSGSIVVQSASGQGSTFSFSIPIDSD